MGGWVGWWVGGCDLALVRLLFLVVVGVLVVVVVVPVKDLSSYLARVGPEEEKRKEMRVGGTLLLFFLFFLSLFLSRTGFLLG